MPYYCEAVTLSRMLQTLYISKNNGARIFGLVAFCYVVALAAAESTTTPYVNRCNQRHNKLPTSLVDMGENMADIKRSPQDDRDAEILAVRISDNLVASKGNYKRITADLKAIRRVYKRKTSAILGDGATQGLILQHGYDPFWLSCVNEVFGGRQIHVSPTIVRFKRIYNAKLLVAAYTREPMYNGSPGSVEPEGVVGADSDIRLLNKRVGGTHRYVFSGGKGDCTAGCTDWEHVTFDVTLAGDVISPKAEDSPQLNRCGQINDKYPPSLDSMGEYIPDIISSPRSDRNAEILAVRISDKVVASASNYKRISADLKAIRRVYKFTSSAVLGDGAAQGLILKAGYDPLWLGCVNEVYGGRVHQLQIVPLTTVHFSRIYNAKFLVAAYTRKPMYGTSRGDVEAEYMVGTNSNIRLLNARVGGTHRYVFSQGTGDCTAGCTDWEYNSFEVTPDGKVTRREQDASSSTTATTTKHCESWCPNTSGDWEKKCSWNQCKGCSECRSNGPGSNWIVKLYYSIEVMQMTKVYLLPISDHSVMNVLITLRDSTFRRIILLTCKAILATYMFDIELLYGVIML